MQRINLSDGRWFDLDRATKWNEATRWDGSNHLSIATGSQWHHEALYLTASGTWIINSWSQWQGSRASWEIVEPDQAARWLVVNGHELPDSLSDIGAALEV